MVNPIYKWTLAANGGQETQVYPVYKDDLAKEYELETNQEFYRAKLSGKLTFVRDDYDFIASQSFDTQFDIKIYISYDAGQTWTEYWYGQFWKTNCTFNADDENVTLTPDVIDQYTDVLAGMEKEYNLIELAPEIVPVNLDKRPMIQVYVPGQTVIGCFLSGMWWEQECEAVTDENALQNTYYFWKNKTKRFVEVTQQATPAIPEIYWGDPWNVMGIGEFANGGYIFQHYAISQSGGSVERFAIIRASDSQMMWWVQFVNQQPKTYPIELTLQPYEGSGATGNIKIYIHDLSVWARYVCDVESAMGLNTYPIPAEDIVENNRNYTRVIGYDFPNTIIFYDGLSTTPTQWGLYQPGFYYKMFVSSVMGINESFPIARNAWGRISLWFTFDVFDWLTEQYWRKEYTLRHAYPLASVISVLLAQVAPNLTHEETAGYSQFLYGDENPLGITQRIFITPKSNMISLGYDQPAQKAPVTLKRILDMLRDCFRCYWFVDDQNQFRIEHISFFRNGGTYDPGGPGISRNLTIEQVTRNGKKWAFDTSEYKFDKPEMAARYQFGWMDDVTQLFEGNPIDIVSKYVNPDNIEQIDASQFTSDVDYILLNPGEISKDGFVLLAAVFVERGTDNLFVVGDSLQNSYINSSGQINSISGFGVTNYIPISTNGVCLKGTDVYFADGCYFNYYDANQNLIGTVQGLAIMSTLSDGAYLIPNRFNAKYVRLTVGHFSTTVDWTIVTYINGYKLPYVNFELNFIDHYLQNAYAAFIWLQQYYFWDMPARYFKYNGVQMTAQGIKKLKTQTLRFPAFTDPNTLQLIKTSLGNGTIQKMSINLSSRNAQTTLKYDTE